jgi:hypothetical protein
MRQFTVKHPILLSFVRDGDHQYESYYQFADSGDSLELDDGVIYYLDPEAKKWTQSITGPERIDSWLAVKYIEEVFKEN